MWVDLIGSRRRVTCAMFPLRLLIGLLLGYFAGALGGAIFYSYLAVAASKSFRALDIHGNTISILLVELLVAPLATAFFLMQFLLFAMIPAALASLPFALAAALCARTTLVPAMLSGSVVGMGVGWPAAMRYYDEWDPSFLPLAAAAGASFMVPLWHFTIGFELRKQTIGRPQTPG